MNGNTKKHTYFVLSFIESPNMPVINFIKVQIITNTGVDMKKVTFLQLESFLKEILSVLGMSAANIKTIVNIYSDITKRGVGHHDIHNFPSRVEKLRTGQITVNPEFKLLSSFGCMENWDGNNGLGELINTHIMRRAIDLASVHGMGFCTVRNSNHYLASYPYVKQAANLGYIGLIIAKGLPSMGVPGAKGKVVGQSPIGFAFPTGNEWPVLMDICLAYASGEDMFKKAKSNTPIPAHWGVDSEGNYTTDAGKVLRGGTKYPIGEHKGFGLAILCELLTGVMSQGLILDQTENDEDIRWKSTSHTAIAIKADALMDMNDYIDRSTELIDRIDNISPGIHIPGYGSYQKEKSYNKKGEIELDDEIIEKLNECAKSLNLDTVLC